MLTSLTNALNIPGLEQGTMPAKDRLKEMFYINGLIKNTIEQGVRILICKREEIPISLAMLEKLLKHRIINPKYIFVGFLRSLYSAKKGLFFKNISPYLDTNDFKFEPKHGETLRSEIREEAIYAFRKHNVILDRLPKRDQKKYEGATEYDDEGHLKCFMLRNTNCKYGACDTNSIICKGWSEKKGRTKQKSGPWCRVLKECSNGKFAGAAASWARLYIEKAYAFGNNHNEVMRYDVAGMNVLRKLYNSHMCVQHGGRKSRFISIEGSKPIDLGWRRIKDGKRLAEKLGGIF